MKPLARWLAEQAMNGTLIARASSQRPFFVEREMSDILQLPQICHHVDCASQLGEANCAFEIANLPNPVNCTIYCIGARLALEGTSPLEIWRLSCAFKSARPDD